MLSVVTAEVLAAVTAAAAVGTFGTALGILRSVRRTERAVFGSEHVDHDDGVVGLVEEHDDRLDRHETVLYGEGYIAVPDGGGESDDETEPTTVAGIELPDATNESGTERDGVLSYAGEWHALLVGLSVGLVAAVTGQVLLLGVVAAVALGLEAGKRKSKALGEVHREPWYALGGLLVYLPTEVILAFA
jgi:hypothetical protein